jgi:putative membrane protein insertion efficiency factor
MMHDGGPARLVGLALRGAIRAYQLLISPAFPPSCRYYPSCSHYAAQAVELHGPWRGSLLAARRLLRCHPWGGSGYDPVPDKPVSAGPVSAGPVSAGPVSIGRGR